MARPLRIEYPGAVYHVILRGNGGRTLFSPRRIGCAFCLMTNHVHLAIQVGEVSLSRVMQNVGFRYTSYLNRKRKKTGHV